MTTNDTTTKAGDIVFAAGCKYQLSGPMEWSEFHKSWYAPGFRWIKSRSVFSKVNAIHHVGPHFEKVEA